MDFKDRQADERLNSLEKVMLRQIAYYLKEEQLLKPEEFIRLLKMVEKEPGRRPCGP